MTDVQWQDPVKALQRIKELINDYPDFPREGILFRDIMRVFQEPEAVQAVVNLMVTYIDLNYAKVDVIIGLDARGFLIGPMIAVALKKPFVPVRKQGKLPGECISVTSTKEYGKDILEIQKNSIKPGQNVVVVDDLLATGGTMASTCELVRLIGGTLCGTLCLIELSELKGKEKFDAPFHALISY